jgi:MFS transporter, FSR family, fosmidomycin resistance protein
VGIVVILLLPLQLTLIILPFVGLVLNGVTTVIYGSVPNYAAPDRRTHLLSVFYTIAIGAAAVSPPAAGFLSDAIGTPGTVIIVSTLTLATIPCGRLCPCLPFCSNFGLSYGCGSATGWRPSC